MTYEELLELCQDQWHQTDCSGAVNAIRAVVELHKSDGHFCVECSHDVDYLFNYPCKTIQAIEKALS